MGLNKAFFDKKEWNLNFVDCHDLTIAKARNDEMA